MLRFKPFYLVLALIAILCLSFGGLLAAQEKGPPPPEGQIQGGGPGGGPPNRDEKLDAFREIWDGYLAKTEPIHDQLVDQRLIYQAMAGNSNASIDDVRKVVDEMRRLKGLLGAEKDAVMKTLADSGLESYAPGPGHGRRGPFGRGSRSRYSGGGPGGYDAPGGYCGGRGYGPRHGWNGGDFNRRGRNHRGWHGGWDYGYDDTPGRTSFQPGQRHHR
jgi:hypothetical protein